MKKSNEYLAAMPQRSYSQGYSGPILPSLSSSEKYESSEKLKRRLFGHTYSRKKKHREEIQIDKSKDKRREGVLKFNDNYY